MPYSEAHVMFVCAAVKLNRWTGMTVITYSKNSSYI